MTDGRPCWADLTAGAGRDFYAAVCGWTFTDDGAVHHEAVALADGRRVAGLGGPEGAPPGWTVYVAVDDAAGTAEAIEEAGGQVLHGPDDDGRGGLVVVAIDAGGAAFGVWESDEHAAPVPWVAAASAEPGQTKAFYGTVLGWTHEPTDEPGTTTLHHDGDAFGAVVFAGDALPHWLAHFPVADVDAAAAATEAAGGSVVGKEDGKAVLEDPTGARFAVTARTAARAPRSSGPP
ncbi:VOC family protein [Actinomycetospora termitidis]|uniref:VOC family protein n=1 Tax=Actinomycetospora termitidis TaxID=3053470 RepID=A0ABT7MIL1_9PSEU|nr:VOC family protein [Actinomycetospora sp. Odt1-22]MDL5160301.1 VOC family protein [Actinomycetospora sp. Odt1-22]